MTPDQMMAAIIAKRDDPATPSDARVAIQAELDLITWPGISIEKAYAYVMALP